VFDNADRWTGVLLSGYRHVKSSVVQNAIVIDRSVLLIFSADDEGRDALGVPAFSRTNLTNL